MGQECGQAVDVIGLEGSSPGYMPAPGQAGRLLSGCLTRR